MPEPATDLIAGYVSGVVGIAIGNPLDIVKVQLQNSSSVSSLASSLLVRSLSSESVSSSIDGSLHSVTSFSKLNYGFLKSLLHGVAAPMLGYGALNALLFVSYSVSLNSLDLNLPSLPELAKIFTAGTVAGLGTVAVSAPTEIIKCRAQATHGHITSGTGIAGKSSWTVCKEIYAHEGLRGFFKGGLVTGLRDGFGYGVYFWTYNVCKNWQFTERESKVQAAIHLLIAGGLAGCASWASIFPLDVIKTRYQSQNINDHSMHSSERYSSSWDCVKKTYASGGMRIFFRGLRVTMIRAFIVNAAQFGTYEWVVRLSDGKI
ncbi:mitochondrial carrier domain-containing protein [Lipomyces japonicus]|uniref:mitochondrial carrier domain-containing protein n=1 Tax=Lipomyces japonicus TaxID=56871 RepID=UPI0034CF2174